MPIASDRFEAGTAGTNEIEVFLRARPDQAFTLHEIEAALIGAEVNRRLHLDRFIAALVLLGPQLADGRVAARVVDGVPHLRWKGDGR